MKKLIAICIVLAFLYSANTVSAQATWASYSNLAHTTPSDEFTDLHCTVYMYGEGFDQKLEYKIVYWDGEGNKRIVESPVIPSSPPARALSSEHTFDVPDVAGNWHCTVYSNPDIYSPAAYDPEDTYIVADDTSYGGYAFNVAESAIPEFPTVMAAIGVAGLCFGIYYWIRKRRSRA